MKWNRATVTVPSQQWTQTTNFVVTSTVGFLFDYAQARGLGTDRIATNRQPLETALYSYLSTRHLRTVLFEVYDEGARTRDEAIEWFDITFAGQDAEAVSESENQRVQEEEEEEFNQYRTDGIERIQDLDPLPSNVEYRILLGLGTDSDLGPSLPDIEGWAETTPRSPPGTAAEHDDWPSDLTWYGVLL